MRDALITAVTSGDEATLAMLLADDPSLASASDEQGVSVLLLALYRRQPGARDALLRAGAEVGALEAAALGDVERLHVCPLDARGGDGFTPLHLAAFFGGPAAVRFLLDRGVDPDADGDNTFGVRPLHSAAAARDRDSVRALLEAGADPNVRQNGGFTPLHEAAHNDDAEMARMLLARGADPAARTDDGKDALAFASDAAVRRLLRGGSPHGSP